MGEENRRDSVRRLRLRPYQVEGRRFLTSGRSCKLLADDPGLGKTIQVLAAVNYLWFTNKPQKVLVVCPAAVKAHWSEKITEHTLLTPTTVDGTKFQVPKDAQAVVVNYTLLTYDNILNQLLQHHWDVLVCDESHYLGNGEAKRTARLLGNDGLFRKAKKIWCLSGTPVENRVFQFFPILKVLASDLIHPYTKSADFAYRYCDGYFDQETFTLVAKGASNIPELNERLKKFMLRRTIEEVLQQLPPVTIRHHYLDLDIDWLDHEEENLDAVATVRRIVALEKIELIIKKIKNTLDTIKKIIVFYHHRQVEEELKNRLTDYGVVSLTGGLNMNQRNQRINEFKEPENRVMLASITAAGTGLDGLQSITNHIVFSEIDWTPGRLTQAIGRLRRIGQENPVFVDLYLAPDTIEEGMWASVQSKQRVIESLME